MFGCHKVHKYIKQGTLFLIEAKMVILESKHMKPSAIFTRERALILSKTKYIPILNFQILMRVFSPKLEI